MKILGIDPGLTTTGWGVVEKEQNNFTCIQFGVIRTNTEDLVPKRLLVVAKEIRAVLGAHKPELVALERLFWGANRATAMNVAYARGVILCTIAELGIPVVEFTPLETKRALSVFGRAPKQQMQTVVKMFLGLPAVPSPPDAADALALAVLAGFHAK